MEIVTHVLTSPQAGLLPDNNDSQEIKTAKETRRRVARENIGINVGEGDIAAKSDMSVVPGTGADADKTTITLKPGTQATVLTQHQDLSGKADKATTLGGYGIVDAYTKTQVDELLGTVGGFRKVELDPETLEPAEDDPSTKYIYLTKDDHAPQPDQYTEWIWLEPDEGEQFEPHWEIIGETTVSLDDVIEDIKVDGTSLVKDSKSVNIPLANGNTTGVVTGADKAKWDNWASAVFPIIPKPNIVVIGGRTYPTVKIGNQMWMAENLNLTWPTLELNQTTVSTSKARANYYGNASSAEGTKGLLYNGPAVTYIENNSDILEIPSGWHVATLNDWNTLYAAVGGTSVAAKKLKTTSGWANSGNGTDDYGFAAVPNGLAQESTFSSDVVFQNGTDKAFYWASNATVGRYYALLQTGDNAQCDMFNKMSTLLSVRLVKNLA